MIVIGYDRYNVIVKGFTGTKITPGKVSVITNKIVNKFSSYIRKFKVVYEEGLPNI
jgi:hypothetical protein